MKIVSIEYAHIYTNQQIAEVGSELMRFKNEIDKLVRMIGKDNICLAVMVDDYSFPDPNFNYQEFIKLVETQTEYKIDTIIRESELIKYCDAVLSEIVNISLKNNITEYIVKNKKYPCSLFIATWYIIRLGKIKSNLINSEFLAENLINILPKSFQEFEEKGFEIIKHTQWCNKLINIKNIYINGRDI